MPYRAPTDEIRFVMTHVTGYAAVAATPRFAEAGNETVAAVLEETGRLCTEVFAPLNRVGDRTPARLDNGVVRLPPGFAEAYRAGAEAGLLAMAADPAQGGLGLPQMVAMAAHEMVAGANTALHLGFLLTAGQIEALEHHGSADQRATIIPRLIAGDWTGTMNLTEPQAGTDLGALRARAEPLADGSYAITGQKIFITWGDTDFTRNTSHLVLARLPQAPAGVRGISLFWVPKVLPDGARNALRVVGLEHKLGIHGSPTATMAYDGAQGWLVGAPHAGLAAMFTMMNNARLGVAMQGVGLAEAAFQAARDYAASRVQGRTAEGGAIIGHADVRRMLARMQADILAARAIGLWCAQAIDLARATGAPGWATRAALLTPIAKAFGTDTGHDCAHLAIQVHGGMGFIEETGVAQIARDVRITQIYEGTNGVQAMDLVGRKLAENGTAALTLIEEVCLTAEGARTSHPALADALWQAAFSLREATEGLVARAPEDRGAVAVAYLRAFARVLGGQAHVLAAQAGDPARGRLASFYMQHCLPEVLGLLAEVREGDLGGVTAADLVR